MAVLPAGVQINDASGLIPASGRGTLASVGTVDTSSSVAQLTAVPLSHVQLAPVQVNHAFCLHNIKINFSTRAESFFDCLIQNLGLMTEMSYFQLF